MQPRIHVVPKTPQSVPFTSLLSETQSLIAVSRELRERNIAIRAELAATIKRLNGTMSQSLALNSRDGAVAAELPGRLTKRERTVLVLVAEGYSSKQIATWLGITFKTAVCHRTHIMEKLNLHDVASLTRFAVRHRFVEA